MPTLNFTPTLADVLKHEYSREICREYGTLKSGANAAGSLARIGLVLAERAVDTTAANITVTAGTNTGNGALTKDATAPVQPGARAGNYTVRITEAVANGGRFVVLGPDGLSIGTGVVGTAFTGEVKFTLADGATDFVVGDSWTITVPEGDKKLVPCVNAPQADGTHRPVGILLMDVDASAADQPVVYLKRGPAILSASALVWDSTIDTVAKRSAKLATLAAAGIVTRTTA